MQGRYTRIRMTRISINKKWVLISLPIITIILIALSIYLYSTNIANSYAQEDLLVTNLTPNSVTIILKTDKPVDSQLAYASDQVELNTFNVLLNKLQIYRSDLNGDVDMDSRLHYFELTGLEPNTTYNFGFLKGKIFLTNSTNFSYKFTTLATSEELDVPDPIYGKIEGLSEGQPATITMTLASKESGELRSSRTSALISKNSTYTIDAGLFVDNISGKTYTEDQLNNFDIKARVYSDQIKYAEVILHTDRLKPASTITVANTNASMLNNSIAKQVKADTGAGKWVPVCIKTGEHAPILGGKVQIDEQTQYTFYYQYAASDKRDYNADGKQTWRDVCLKWSTEVCNVFNDKPNLLASCNDKSIPDNLPSDFQQRNEQANGSASTSNPNEGQETAIDDSQATVTDIGSGDNGILDVPLGGTTDNTNSDNTLEGADSIESMWNLVHSDNADRGNLINNINIITSDFGGNAACITYKQDSNNPPAVTVKCKPFGSVQKDEYILLSHELTHGIQYRCSDPNLPGLQDALNRIRELTAETNGMRLGSEKRGIDPVTAGYGGGNGYYYFNYSYGNSIIEGYANQVEPKLANLVIGSYCKSKGVNISQIGSCTNAALKCMETEYQNNNKNNTLQNLINTRVSYQLLAYSPLLEIQKTSLPKSYKIYAEAPAGDNLAQESGTYNVFFDGKLIGTQEIILGDNQNLLTIKVFKDKNNNGKKDNDEDYLPTTSIQLQKQASIFKYKLNVGWNLINVPILTNSTTLKARDLMEIWKEDGTIVEKISTYSSGKFVTYTNRADAYGEDFDIQLGQSIFVFVREPKTAILTGQLPEADVPVIFNNGWNLVGPVKEGKTAQQAISDLSKQGITSNTVSNFENGSYNSYIYENSTSFGSDFKLQPNKGYFIKVNSNGGKSATL
jgi:hypothetical protein